MSQWWFDNEAAYYSFFPFQLRLIPRSWRFGRYKMLLSLHMFIPIAFLLCSMRLESLTLLWWPSIACDGGELCGLNHLAHVTLLPFNKRLWWRYPCRGALPHVLVLTVTTLVLHVMPGNGLNCRGRGHEVMSIQSPFQCHAHVCRFSVFTWFWHSCLNYQYFYLIISPTPNILWRASGHIHLQWKLSNNMEGHLSGSSEFNQNWL